VRRPNQRSKPAAEQRLVGREARQREVWSALGSEDPDWAVLTVRDRRLGGWDGELDEFYASGIAAVEECLALAQPTSLGRALDYGTGTGRLSFALAARFEQVTAVDISPGMLETVNSRAATAGITNISTVEPAALTTSRDHDFAISLLVLQHLPTLAAIDTAIGLIAGTLRPGAPAVIELPERINMLRARLQPRFHAYRMLRALGISHERLHRAGLSGMSMLRVTEPQARTMFATHGLTVVDRAVSHDSNYDYVRWVVRADE
jgi:2-polyprenyl-3-methyl-5-hydroxy-6-metoxy-1,4-benzoquinol methylase